MAAAGAPPDGQTSGPLLQTEGEGGRVTASKLRRLAQAIEALPNRSVRHSAVVPPSPVPPAHAPPPLAPTRGSQSLRAGFLSTVASAGAAAKFRKTIAPTNSPLDHLYGSSLRAKVRPNASYCQQHSRQEFVPLLLEAAHARAPECGTRRPQDLECADAVPPCTKLPAPPGVTNRALRLVIAASCPSARALHGAAGVGCRSPWHQAVVVQRSQTRAPVARATSSDLSLSCSLSL